jgi:hypothetical protein
MFDEEGKMQVGVMCARTNEPTWYLRASPPKSTGTSNRSQTSVGKRRTQRRSHPRVAYQSNWKRIMKMLSLPSNFATPTSFTFA